MKLATFYSRIFKGTHEPEQLASLSREISEARERTRYNSVAIDSGDRALRNMAGMMRLLTEADSGKIER